MKTSVLKISKSLVALLIAVLLNLATRAQNYVAIPEFVFTNAKLVSGSSNQDGAVYRFSNIAPGYDATVTILGRSASNVVLDSIDLAPSSGVGGFDKALQPQLGIKGNVPANSNWWMKFQVNFLQAGTNKAANIGKFNATALDVDGDGVSIAENVKMFSANSSSYSAATYLKQPALIAVACPKCNKISLPMACAKCLGIGYTIDGGGNQKMCDKCKGAGLVFTTCGDPFTGEDLTVQGPTTNAPGIDTTSTANMVTFAYANVSSFTFQYGGTSGSTSSTAGERLNSMWFKAFSLSTPSQTLPVKLTNFSATLDKKDVKLSWTGHEENFSHYVIQRSNDGKNFSDVAIVFANGNTTESSYTYKDANASSSTNSLFYRLEMVDQGKQEGIYSSVQVIRLEKEEASKLIAYPNPATDQVRVALPKVWQGKQVTLQLYNASGNTVQSLQFGSASQTETIQLSKLTKGFYLIKATCNDEVAEQRIIKN